MRAFAPDAAPHALEIFPGAALQQPLTLRKAALVRGQQGPAEGRAREGQDSRRAGHVRRNARRKALCPPRPLHRLHPDHAEEAGDEREPPP